MKKSEYKCARCGNIYKKGWTDKEARDEATQWGDDLKKQGEAVICDDCYKDFMEFAKQHRLLKN